MCRPTTTRWEGRKGEAKRSNRGSGRGGDEEERNIPPSVVQHPHNAKKIQQTGSTGRRIDIVLLFFLLFSLYSFSSLSLSSYSFLFSWHKVGEGCAGWLCTLGCILRVIYMLGAIFPAVKTILLSYIFLLFRFSLFSHVFIFPLQRELEKMKGMDMYIGRRMGRPFFSSSSSFVFRARVPSALLNIYSSSVSLSLSSSSTASATFLPSLLVSAAAALARV